MALRSNIGSYAPAFGRVELVNSKREANAWILRLASLNRASLRMTICKVLC
jgi:hypothetical protein